MQAHAVIDRKGTTFEVGSRVYDCVDKAYGTIKEVDHINLLLTVRYDDDGQTCTSSVHYFVTEAEGKLR